MRVGISLSVAEGLKLGEEFVKSLYYVGLYVRIGIFIDSYCGCGVWAENYAYTLENAAFLNGFAYFSGDIHKSFCGSAEFEIE